MHPTLKWNLAGTRLRSIRQQATVSKPLFPVYFPRLLPRLFPQNNMKSLNSFLLYFVFCLYGGFAAANSVSSSSSQSNPDHSTTFTATSSALNVGFGKGDITGPIGEIDLMVGGR